ncbi:hypothetical protein RhiJN_11620 [Ceratobasidium sp. AG-Ba]|nr:hypothetical protein RhiJN_11620 [Ceratobasidium sp. AG-Ba]QRW12291.1 hypothetical protein RhiLY_11290 [Ceratobasidium sp. AG-Ba]
MLYRLCRSLKEYGLDPPTTDQIISEVGEDYENQLSLGEVKLRKKELFTILEHSVFSRMFEASMRSRNDEQYSLNYPGGDEKQATVKAWTAPYIGDAALLLRRTLDRMNSGRGDALYANYVPIVQSSGTGKSRAVDELAQQVFTLPFCLRQEYSDTGYPVADKDVGEILLGGGGALVPSNRTVAAVGMDQGVFLKHLFKAAHEDLSAMPTYSSQEALAKAFHSRLRENNYRARFYERVCTKTSQELKPSRTALSLAMERKGSKETLEYEAAFELISLIRIKSGIPPTSKYEERGVDGGTGRKIWLCIYFDESHALTQKVIQPDSSQSRTAYQTLCWVLNRLRSLDLFTIFLSTQSHMSAYSPPKGLFWSERVINDTTPGVQAPICEMSFDNWSGGDQLAAPYQNTLQDVCKIAFMVRFGRPLFWSRYEAGDDDVKRTILSFARKKIAGNRTDKLNSEAELAVLMFRVGLSFDKTRVGVPQTEAKLVRGHMISCHSIPQHREFIYAAASSEPILAEAAAQLMDINNIWEKLAGTLFGLCNNGMIAKGERGELLARLLLTKAHDWVVYGLRSKDVLRPRRFTRPILLADFLEALVGKKNKDEIMKAKPNNTRNGPTLADSPLGQAALNFTHWAKAADDCSVTDNGAWIALTRCMAWQCCDGQPEVDLVTPLMLPPEDAKLGPYTVSAIFWQIKNRATPTRAEIDAERLGFFSYCEKPLSEEISAEIVNSRPYLTIVLNLGISNLRPEGKTGKPKPILSLSASRRISSRGSSFKTTYPRYALSISGCSHDTFPNLIPVADQHIYSSLLSPGNCVTDHARQDLENLEGIMQQKPLWGKANGKLKGSFVQYGDQSSRLCLNESQEEPVPTVEVYEYHEREGEDEGTVNFVEEVADVEMDGTC